MEAGCWATLCWPAALHIAGGGRGDAGSAPSPAAVDPSVFRQTPGANPKVCQRLPLAKRISVFRFSADDKESLWPQISFLPRRAGGSIMVRRRRWLLAGLAIVFWFPALASWWPSDLVRSTTPCRMLCDRGGECRGYSVGGLRHPNAVGLRAGLLPSRSQ